MIVFIFMKKNIYDSKKMYVEALKILTNLKFFSSKVFYITSTNKLLIFMIIFIKIFIYQVFCD